MKKVCLALYILHTSDWVFSSKLPSFITPCRFDVDNEALSRCTLEEARKVQKEFSKGIPELGVESLDPLHVGSFHISAASVTVNQRDVTVKGTSKLEIMEVKLNKDLGTGKITAYGNLTVTSNYNMSGRLLLLPLSGHGKFKIKMENTEITMRFKIKLVQGTDGHQHYEIYDVKPSHKIGNARLRMDGLFGDDPNIGNTVNQVMNDNWRELMKDFGPPSVKAVTDKTIEIINTFYAKVPFEDLFAQTT